MGSLASVYDESEIIGCSFQAINAGGLDQIFPGRGFTIHQLLYQHDKTCCDKRNPNLMFMPSPKIIFDPNEKTQSTDDVTGTKSNNNTKAAANKTVTIDKLLDYTILKESKLGIDYYRCILEKVKILIIEECSNIYTELMARLLVHMICCGSLCKVIIVGNKDQLPSIHCGNVLPELFAALKEFGCTVEFTHNHRVNQNAQNLKDCSDAIRKDLTKNIRFDQKSVIHVPYMNSEQTYGAIKRKDLYLGILEQYIVKIFETYKLTEYDHHIITPMNATRNDLQFIVEKYYHERQYNKRDMPYRKNTYWVGRKMMFRQNNYDLNIINNKVLILKDIVDSRSIKLKSGKIELEKTSHFNTYIRLMDGYVRHLHFIPIEKHANFSEHDIIKVPWNDWSQMFISRASATTVHSFQGAQIPRILFFLPFYSRHTTRELIYTAWTRPIDALIFLGQMTELYKGIKNMEPRRRSILCESIIRDCEAFMNEFPTPDMEYVEELEKLEHALEDLRISEKKKKPDTVKPDVDMTKNESPATQKKMEDKPKDNIKPSKMEDDIDLPDNYNDFIKPEIPKSKPKPKETFLALVPIASGGIKSKVITMADNVRDDKPKQEKRTIDKSVNSASLNRKVLEAKPETNTKKKTKTEVVTISISSTVTKETVKSSPKSVKSKTVSQTKDVKKTAVNADKGAKSAAKNNKSATNVQVKKQYNVPYLPSNVTHKPDLEKAAVVKQEIVKSEPVKKKNTLVASEISTKYDVLITQDELDMFL